MSLLHIQRQVHQTSRFPPISEKLAFVSLKYNSRATARFSACQRPMIFVTVLAKGLGILQDASALRHLLQNRWLFFFCFWKQLIQKLPWASSFPQVLESFQNRSYKIYPAKDQICKWSKVMCHERWSSSWRIFQTDLVIMGKFDVWETKSDRWRHQKQSSFNLLRICVRISQSYFFRLFFMKETLLPWLLHVDGSWIPRMFIISLFLCVPQLRSANNVQHNDSTGDLFAISSPAGRPAALRPCDRPAGQFHVDRPAGQNHIYRPAKLAGWLAGWLFCFVVHSCLISTFVLFNVGFWNWSLPFNPNQLTFSWKGFC